MQTKFWRYAGIAAIFAAAVGGGLYLWSNRPASVAEAPPPPVTAPPATPAPQNYISNAELEEKYGLKVTLIGVSAAGGLVDFRYKIVDAEKATPILHDPNREITLYVVDTGATLTPAKMGMKHHGAVKQGYVPYTFFPNVNSAVKKGSLISAGFGDIHVEPIAAQE